MPPSPNVQVSSFMDQVTNELVAYAAVLSGYELLAAMTLVAYDYLLTLPKERKYLWGAKWTPGKVLYLLVRYLPLVDFPIWSLRQEYPSNVPVDCSTLRTITTATTSVARLLAEVIYLLRTWALWNRSRLVGVLLWGAGSGCLGGSFWGVITYQGAPTTHIPEIPGCIMLPTASTPEWEPYAVVIAFETGPDA